jgi:hypothetical protein
VTQYPNQGYYDPMMQPPMEPAKRSGLAVTALVLSLIGIIPVCGAITAPIGVILGLIGLVTISPPRKGKGMCVAAILLGVIFTALQVWAGIMIVRKFAIPVIEGPRTALAQGFAGNISDFKAEFTGAGATASDAEARAFIEQLRARYGEFQSSAMDQSGPQPQPGSNQPEQTMKYILNFSNRQGVDAEATLVFADQKTGALVWKWSEIKVIDSTQGDLTYPTPLSAPPAIPSATAPADADDAGEEDDSGGAAGG